MNRETAWRVVGGLGAGVLMAGAWLLRDLPYPDICPTCYDHYPWWLCVLWGCW